MKIEVTQDYEKLSAAYRQRYIELQRYIGSFTFKPQLKPLFVPLKTKYFRQFASGEKRSELRAYGPRWNERTCIPGRAITLSRGYGKAERLTGIITEFRKRRGDTFGSTYQQAIVDRYGTLDLWIAEIRVGFLRASEGKTT